MTAEASADICSNATNPDETVKQILAIYPILPGQTLGESERLTSGFKTDIWLENHQANTEKASQAASTQPTQTSSQNPPPPQPAPASAAAPAAASVTDSVPVAAPAPAPLPQAQPTVKSQQVVSQGDLIDFGDNQAAPQAAVAAVGGNHAMLADLQSANNATATEKGKLERLDTETGERDEFVDAQG